MGDLMNWKALTAFSEKTPLTFKEIYAAREGEVLIGVLWLKDNQPEENVLGLFTVGRRTSEKIYLHYLMIDRPSRMNAVLYPDSMDRRRLYFLEQVADAITAIVEEGEQ